MQRYSVCLFISICLCGVLLFSGCGKKEGDVAGSAESIKPEGHLVEETAVTETPASSESALTATDIVSLDQTGQTRRSADTFTDEYKAAYGRSTAPLYPVYFAFDSSLINADQFEKLDQSAEYLLAQKDINIVIEGNTDSRGTEDYNIALGELRAIKVKEFLVNLGVSPERIGTISYGEERPLYPGSDEESWAMNRRADLVIP